jgi:hypothetical protein
LFSNTEEDPVCSQAEEGVVQTASGVGTTADVTDAVP